MNFGIIGSRGFIQSKHRQAIADIGGLIVDECDIDNNKNWQSVCENAKVDVVSICTPTYLHTEMAKHAHFMGKKVILEKPLAVTLEDGEALSKLDNIAVVYQRRYDTQAQIIKAKKDKPHLIIIEFLVKRDPIYWETWRANPRLTGGGNLFNIQIHFLDLLYWWLGNQYKILEADIRRYDRMIDEECFITMHFNGTLVYLRGSSRNHRRDLNVKAFYKDEIITYDMDDGTHTDIYRDFVEKNKYISTKEAFESLKMVHDIYKFSMK